MKVALSKVRLDEDECIVEGFPAELEGIRVWVTAVLERTCVYETPEHERKLISKEKLLVEKGSVPIRRRRLGGPPGQELKTKRAAAGRARAAAAAAADKADGVAPEAPEALIDAEVMAAERSPEVEVDAPDDQAVR